MPTGNLQVIINAIDSKIASLRSSNDPTSFTKEEKTFMSTIADIWRSKFANITFCGRDARMLEFFRSSDFQKLCNNKPLLEKIFTIEAKRQAYPRDYLKMHSEGVDVTLGSILCFGLKAMESTDWLEIGTENADYGLPIDDNQFEARVQLDQERRKKYQENTAPALQNLAMALGVLEQFNESIHKPEYSENLPERWLNIQKFLLTIDANNEIIGKQILHVPNYTPRSMVDQAHWWMTKTFGGEDSDEKKDINLQHNIIVAGQVAAKCKLPVKNLDDFVDKILKERLLLDEWFGHMVTDRAHLIALTYADHPEYVGTDDPSSTFKMRDAILKICEKVQANKDQYPVEYQQLTTRLNKVEGDLERKTAKQVKKFDRVVFPIQEHKVEQIKANIKTDKEGLEEARKAEEDMGLEQAGANDTQQAVEAIGPQETKPDEAKVQLEAEQTIQQLQQGLLLSAANQFVAEPAIVDRDQDFDDKVNDRFSTYLRTVKAKQTFYMNPDQKLQMSSKDANGNLYDLLKRVIKSDRKVITVQGISKVFKSENSPDKDANIPGNKQKFSKILFERFAQVGKELSGIQIDEFIRTQLSQIYKAPIDKSASNLTLEHLTRLSYGEGYGVEDQRKSITVLPMPEILQRNSNDEAFTVDSEFHDEVNSDLVDPTIEYETAEDLELKDEKINAAIAKVASIKNDLYLGVKAMDPDDASETITDYRNYRKKQLILNIPQSGASGKPITCHFNQEQEKDSDARKMTMNAAQDAIDKDTDELALRKMVTIFIEAAIKKGFNTVTASGLYDPAGNPLLFDNDNVQTEKLVKIIEEYSAAAGLKCKIANYITKEKSAAITPELQEQQLDPRPTRLDPLR